MFSDIAVSLTFRSMVLPLLLLVILLSNDAGLLLLSLFGF